MPTQEEIHSRVDRLADRKGKYRKEAYYFIFEALAFTVKELRLTGQQRHVSGQQLLEGVSEFGLDQYGPMTKSVFEHWGVRATRDFGEIVFHLVDEGLMGKTDEDSIEDFSDVYDFETEFDWHKGIGRKFRYDV